MNVEILGNFNDLLVSIIVIVLNMVFMKYIDLVYDINGVVIC